METIIFEQPLNERIRNLLKLEFLFNEVDHALLGNDEMHHRAALNAMLSILSLIIKRNDLKKELIKEIDRLTIKLTDLKQTSGVDPKVLSSLLSQLESNAKNLHTQTGLGQQLRDNEFLSSLLQRVEIQAGSCSFDLPNYHFWLQHNSHEQRRTQLHAWLDELLVVRQAIDISLQMIRNSVPFQPQRAENGFFQQSLDSQQPYQLIRVSLPSSSNCFPEISGGKHRFTLRFMQFDLDNRCKQSDDNIDFKLSCCAI